MATETEHFSLGNTCVIHASCDGSEADCRTEMGERPVAETLPDEQTDLRPRDCWQARTTRSVLSLAPARAALLRLVASLREGGRTQWDGDVKQFRGLGAPATWREFAAQMLLLREEALLLREEADRQIRDPLALGQTPAEWLARREAEQRFLLLLALGAAEERAIRRRVRRIQRLIDEVPDGGPAALSAMRAALDLAARLDIYEPDPADDTGTQFSHLVVQVGWTGTSTRPCRAATPSCGRRTRPGSPRPGS